MQYVTNESGQQVGVLLDIASYQKLVNPDPDLLQGLNQAELKALANSKLSPFAQTRLDVLLAKQTRSVDETDELDALLEQVDQLNILKTRAKYTLQQIV